MTRPLPSRSFWGRIRESEDIAGLKSAGYWARSPGSKHWPGVQPQAITHSPCASVSSTTKWHRWYYLHLIGLLQRKRAKRNSSEHAWHTISPNSISIMLWINGGKKFSGKITAKAEDYEKTESGRIWRICTMTEAGSSQRHPEPSCWADPVWSTWVHLRCGQWHCAKKEWKDTMME